MSDTIRTPSCRTPDQWVDLDYSYDDLHSTPVANVPFEVACERDPSIVQSGVTDADGKAHVEGLIPGPVAITFHPSSDVAEQQKADQLRKDLQLTLDSIIAGIALDAANKDDLWQQTGTLEKGLVYTGAFMDGVWESATGFVDFIQQAGAFLAKAGCAYFDVWSAIVSGDILVLQTKLKQAQEQGEEMVDGTVETFENLCLLLSDEDVRAMLYDFPERYWDAHHSVDQVHMAGAAGADLIVGLVIGALSGGAGAGVVAAKVTARGGQLMTQAMQIVLDLALQLKKIKTKLQFKSSTHNTARMKVPRNRPNHPINDKHAGNSTQTGTNGNGVACEANSKTCTSGEPISMITGEELLSDTDFTIPGLIPLAWNRLYRTSNPRNRGLGHGWAFPTCETLQVGNQSIVYSNAEGRQIEFPVPQIGQFSSNSAEGLFLHRDWHALFYLKQPGQPDKLFIGDDNKAATLRLAALIDTVGNRWDCFYNPNSRLIERMQSSWGSQIQFHAHEQGPAKGLLERITQSLPGEATPKTLVRYHYSADNDLIAVEDAGGDAERFQYQNHIITQRTLRTGFSFYFEWDQLTPKARCLRQWGDDLGDGPIYDYRFEWNDAERTNRSIDSYGNALQVHYNQRGQLVQEIDPQGHTTSHDYDAQGRKVKTIDPLGNETQFFYDSVGNLTGQVDGAGGGFSLLFDADFRPISYSDAEGNTWLREYNDQGLVAKTIDAEGNQTQYFYNDQGLPEVIVDAQGHKHVMAWNESGRLQTKAQDDTHPTHYHYDTHGNLAQVESSGQRTQYRYNAKGDVIAIKYPDGGVAKLHYNANRQLTAYTDPLGRTTGFEYDGLSQITRRTDPAGHTLTYLYDRERNLIGLINENGERYHLQYDANERLIEEIGFDGRVQQYQYNPLGHLTAHIEGRFQPDDAAQDQHTTYFKRDPKGRLLQKNTPDGEDTTFHYNKNGRLISAQNPHRTLAFEYSPNGHLLAEIQGQHRQDHRYNSQGLRIGTELPGGQQLSYEFDPLGRFTALDYNGQRLTQLQRNPQGQEIARSQGALNSGCDYDPAGRLTRHWVMGQGQQHAVIDRQYHWDGAGRLTDIQDARKGHTHYTYDALDRLKAVDGFANEQFDFDPAGNILSPQSGGGSTPTKTPGNRLAFHSDRHFTYDERGNLIEERRGTGGNLTTRYHYNSQNQLIKVEKSGAGGVNQTITYAYDPLGRRIRKTDEFGETTFLWNGDVLLSEKRNHKDKLYLYEPNSFKPLAFIENNQCYFYHLDHLGTPQELTNWEGQIVWSARYRVYGNVVRQDVEAVQNNLRFQGQYWDEETGLHYNRFRYYDPGTGQFTQQDPIGLLGGVNNYQYAPNATGWVDPLGLKCKENTWNEFQKDHKGQFKNPTEASKAYKELKDNQSPWPHGYDPNSNVITMQPGETFNMIVDNGKENMPGRFGTTDSIPDANYGRQSLAIKEEWKPTLDNVVTYRVRKPFDVYEGPVGPQIDGSTYLKGGGSQITFTDQSVWENARPNKYNSNLTDPYLEIVDVKPLKP